MNREALTGLLQRLDAVPGISGFEEKIGVRIAEEMAGCYDESRIDTLGNRLFIKKGREPAFTVLIWAQMDEAGFIVSGISPAGYLHALPVGLHSPQPAGAQGYTILTANGPVSAVSGFESISDPQKPFELLLDIGARSRQGAKNRGVSVGDPVISDRKGQPLGKAFFTCRSAESRAGCAALIQTMQRLKGVQTQATVIACAAVQGELGGKGIRAAVHATAPQLLLGLRACPGEDREENSGHAHPFPGGGPAIRAYYGQAGHMMPLHLRQRLMDTAHSRRIPYQLEITSAGDGQPPDGCSILEGEIGIPIRYIHSFSSMVDTGDILQASRLAAAFLQELGEPL